MAGGFNEILSYHIVLIVAIFYAVLLITAL